MDALSPDPVATVSRPSVSASQSEQKRTKSTQFQWTKLNRRAAALVAVDERTDCAIAKRLGIGRTTLHHLKRRPEFAAGVERIRERLGKLAARYAVGHLARRLADLDSLHRRLWRIIRQRAADPKMKDVPGGSSGFIVRKTKVIGRGADARVIENYVFDAALARELREVLKHAAIECGQWGKGPDVSKPEPKPFVFNIVTVPSPPYPREVPLLGSAIGVAPGAL